MEANDTISDTSIRTTDRSLEEFLQKQGIDYINDLSFDDRSIDVQRTEEEHDSTDTAQYDASTTVQFANTYKSPIQYNSPSNAKSAMNIGSGDFDKAHYDHQIRMKENKSNDSYLSAADLTSPRVNNEDHLAGLLRINVILEEKGYSSLPLSPSDIDPITM